MDLLAELGNSFSVSSLISVWHSLRVADFCDVAVISMLIYFAFLGISSPRAVRVVRGILLLVFLYAIARQTGMALTVTLFQRFFTVFLLAIVVIFQEDLRIFFERLAVWRWEDPDAPHREELIQAIGQSAAAFSRNRTGALIVLKGRDPVDRHIARGQLLGGEVSSALLESIFDPHSAGHDGAVIIEDGRITRFGVHLPLSHHREGIERRGTRHAAALGLAERVDAFCVVVSEENGSISAAHNGSIVELPSRRSLENALEIFLKKKTVNSPYENTVTKLKHRIGLKVASVAVGSFLWLIFVQGFKPVEGTVSVPVSADNIPEGLRIDRISPPRVMVRLAGLSRDIARSQNPTVSVNLSVAHAGKLRVVLSDLDVRVSGPVRVMSIEPSMIDVELIPVRSSAVLTKPVKQTTKHTRWGLW
jgi:diadenylate cyclase